MDVCFIMSINDRSFLLFFSIFDSYVSFGWKLMSHVEYVELLVGAFYGNLISFIGLNGIVSLEIR